LHISQSPANLQALHPKVADLTQQEWLKSMIEAQADTTREFATSYVTTARGLLK
jgi:hypothetical protein